MDLYLINFVVFNLIAINETITMIITIKEGEIALWVLFNNISDSTGVIPAERLAAIEYNKDKTVQRSSKGNISASMTGTVA